MLICRCVSLSPLLNFKIIFIIRFYFNSLTPLLRIDFMCKLLASNRLQIEGKQSRLISIFFPLIILIHQFIPIIVSIIFIFLLINPLMEEREFASKRKTKYFNYETVTKTKNKFTTPRIQQYQSIVNKYKGYINNLPSKIDTICEKEQYRNYLKQQKLNTLKTQLLSRKNQLQKTLNDKLDPIKSSNGKLHLEILQLKNLETAYKQNMQKLEQNVQERQQQIKNLTSSVTKQKMQIKNILKSSFIKLNQKENCPVTITKLTSRNTDTSNIKHNSIYSSSRQSILAKLSNSWEQKTATTISEQEQKLIMLRLLCVYAKSKNSDQIIAINPLIVQLIQKQIKTKGQLLDQIKQLLNKQKRSSITQV